MFAADCLEIHRAKESEPSPKPANAVNQSGYEAHGISIFFGFELASGERESDRPFFLTFKEEDSLNGWKAAGTPASQRLAAKNG